MVANVGRINHKLTPSIAERLKADPKPSRLPDDLLEDLRIVVARTIGGNPKADRQSGVYLSKNQKTFFIIERIGLEKPIYETGKFIYFKRNGKSFSSKVVDIVETREAFIFQCDRPKAILENEIPLNFCITSKGGK